MNANIAVYVKKKIKIDIEKTQEIIDVTITIMDGGGILSIQKETFQKYVCRYPDEYDDDRSRPSSRSDSMRDLYRERHDKDRRDRRDRERDREKDRYRRRRDPREVYNPYQV